MSECLRACVCVCAPACAHVCVCMCVCVCVCVQEREMERATHTHTKTPPVSLCHAKNIWGSGSRHWWLRACASRVSVYRRVIRQAMTQFREPEPRDCRRSPSGLPGPQSSELLSLFGDTTLPIRAHLAWTEKGLSVGRLRNGHATVLSQGPRCFVSFCAKIDVENQTCYLAYSRCTTTGPTSPDIQPHNARRLAG